ncbi:MAG TPA: DUF3618 domain-containing protein [Stellaceae bacterium]
MARQSEQLEREAEAVRIELAHSLDQLRARMTPGQIVHEVNDYIRETPVAEFGRNLVRDIRESPLPVLVIFAGMVWAIAASALAQRRIASRPTTPAAIEPISPEKAPVVAGQDWEVAPLNEAVE